MAEARWSTSMMSSSTSPGRFRHRWRFCHTFQAYEFETRHTTLTPLPTSLVSGVTTKVKDRRSWSLSSFQRPFSRWTSVSRCLLKQRMMEVVGTTGAIGHTKLQSNHHHQQSNIQFFTGRMPFLSPNQQCQSTEGKISHTMDLPTPNSPRGLPVLFLTTNSSWLPWGRFAMPLISPLMPVPLQRSWSYCLTCIANTWRRKISIKAKIDRKVAHANAVGEAVLRSGSSGQLMHGVEHTVSAASQATQLVNCIVVYHYVWMHSLLSADVRSRWLL